MGSSPDSRIARDALELLRDTSPAHLVNHCLRSFAWAEAIAAIDGVDYDREVLFVAAALHDLGLLDAYDTGSPFEDDGARAAAAFAGERGWSARRTAPLVRAIARHVSREVTAEDGAAAYLLWHATSLDVSGTRHEELPSALTSEVLGQFPRLRFQVGFTALVARQAGLKPHSRAAELVQEGILDRILSCPLDASMSEPGTGPDPGKPVASLYGALALGDVDELERLLAPDFRAVLTPGLPLGLGGAAYGSAHQMIHRGWGVVAHEFSLTPVPDQVLLVDDDTVVVFGTYRGRARRTGRAIEARFAHRWWISDGRFTALHQVTDSMAWHRSLTPEDAGPPVPMAEP